MESKKRRCKN